MRSMGGGFALGVRSVRRSMLGGWRVIITWLGSVQRDRTVRGHSEYARRCGGNVDGRDERRG